MAKYTNISQPRSVFHDSPLPEDGACLVGYSAVIQTHDLRVPTPDYLCCIGKRHKKYTHERWRVFTPRHRPADTLSGHLTFALKYEGIDLAVLNALFHSLPPKEIEEIIRSEPTGSYSRRLWFLWEWLCGDTLAIEDATTGNFVDLINNKHQYAGASTKSKRHRVNNNLPGTRHFCPLIRRTEKLESFIDKKLSEAAVEHIAYSRRSRPWIPFHSGHLFHLIPATDSISFRSAIPFDAGH